MLHRRLKHSVQSSHAEGNELQHLQRIFLCNFHPCSNTFPLHLSQLSSSSFIQVPSHFQNLPPCVYWVFWADIGI
ncbi:hypothetical protein SLEP1_g10148 [Rubroshorea leprosula]|uniref:Uncharacterized protein n=1 Tax=Rubroshorea leprosula TaxID=152421 RepID=A0AAV5I766_9ROSI|nr:hypothetical protein SLEP1_g10148 [Rubroshorea leprosula]